MNEFESKQGLKPIFQVSGSRVETMRFQSDGSTAFNVYSPTKSRSHRQLAPRSLEVATV
jgi:hypothetical protein